MPNRQNYVSRNVDKEFISNFKKRCLSRCHRFVGSTELLKKYELYLNGQKFNNPINSIDSETIPILREVIRDIYLQQEPSIREGLKKRGFSRFIPIHGGIGEILSQVMPDAILRIPIIHKWNKGQISSKQAIKLIETVLYKIRGYRKAEETSNRAKQVEFINDLIRKHKGLAKYFSAKGLERVMDDLVDDKGVNGLKRRASSKVLLEFYSSKKGLNWFDRTQETYVQAWRIIEKSKWRKGEASVQLFLEAMHDILCEIPGYREAEQAKNRKEQLVKIERFIRQHPRLADYLIHQMPGLNGYLRDSTGKIILKCSVRKLFELYSLKKELYWFDQSEAIYLDTHGKGRLFVFRRDEHIRAKDWPKR
jgi:hypothetical protein